MSETGPLTQPKVSAFDHITLAKTIWGEARGEGFRGMLAVAWVIRNRAAKGGWFGDTVALVCLKPYQFSCWNSADKNSSQLDKLTTDTPVYLSALGIAALVLTADLADPTMGATHYMRTDITDKVKWDDKMTLTIQIGHHSFFRERTI